MNTTVWTQFKYYLKPWDARFEDLRTKDWPKVVARDASAGLLVALMAIPMAMGFAIASGLRPEHGILAGAIAGLVGALFGGSKYNVYGPVAALIPIIAVIMSKYATPTDPYAGHGFIVLICIASGVLLTAASVLGWGRFAKFVPHSIVVGFSVGIALTIAVTQLGEVFGLKTALPGGFFAKIGTIAGALGEVNLVALGLAVATFLITHVLLKASIYIPAPMLALGSCTAVAAYFFGGSGLTLIGTKYGQIPTDFLQVSAPVLPGVTGGVIVDLLFYAAAFAFVCGFESILAATMGDRLANNRGTRFDANKELWGQGIIQLLVPLLNGMPLSGALARTATNIKVGALTPLAGIMKCIFKLALVFFLADYLELVPMACIGGILLWVSFNMIKTKEIKEIFATSRFHAALMVYTAAMVVVAGFLTGVLSALAINIVYMKWFATKLDQKRLARSA